MSQQIIPDTLDNVSDFEEWFEKYELISKANEWDEETLVNNVGIFLKNLPLEKLRTLDEEQKENYTTLKSALKEKLFNKYTCEIAKSKFQLCRQYYDESFETNAQELKRLCRTAYPDLDENVRDMMCKDRFIEGIYNDEVRLWVRNFRPKTLDEAVVFGTVFHANFEKEAEARRNKEADSRREIQSLREEVQSLRCEIQKLKTARLGLGGNKKSVCWCCGSAEHFVQDCLLRNDMLHVNGLIGTGKIPAKMCIDTGANVSLVDECVWRKTGCSLKEVKEEDLTLISFDGKVVDVLGKISTQIYLSDKSFKCDFIVVHNLVVDCIIGSNFLNAMKCVINLNENVLRIDDVIVSLQTNDNNDKSKRFEVGDMVLFCDKQMDSDMFIVKSKLSNSTYRVQSALKGKRNRLIVTAEQIVKA